MKGSSFSCHPQVILQIIMNYMLFWSFHCAMFSSGVTYLLEEKKKKKIPIAHQRSWLFVIGKP